MAKNSKLPQLSYDAGPALWQAFAKRLHDTRLTDRQRRFVAEYLNCLTGIKAARGAGCSPNRAGQQAYENLRKPRIRRLVQREVYLQERDGLVRMRLLEPHERRVPPELRQVRYKI